MPQVYVTGPYEVPSAPVWDANWGNYGGGAAVPRATRRPRRSPKAAGRRCGRTASRTAQGILVASLGVTFGETNTLTYTVEVTINPGQTWGLYVEYQTTSLYKLVGPNGLEYAEVKKPTGTRIGRSC